MTDQKQRVVVVGASPHRERYSNKAVRLLLQHGHEVIPVHPSAQTVEGLPVRHGLDEIEGPVDTITLYISTEKSAALQIDCERLRPGRVIFNPGAENPSLRAALAGLGICTEEACTLVLLNTQQF